MKTYLGDGLYAEGENGMIKLSTQRDAVEHYVYLEPEIYEALQLWVRHERPFNT